MLIHHSRGAFTFLGFTSDSSTPGPPAAALLPPPELAYGDSKRSELITPGAVLIFELDLIEVQGPAKPVASEL